jgi:serine/threonine protein kinase
MMNDASTLVAGLEIRAHLHRGRSLDVYEVWSVERLCVCVAKTVRPDQPEGGAAERLLREGRMLERLTHPHIVRAYETIEQPPIVVLETLSGRTLRRLIRESPEGLPASDVAVLGRQLASALAHLHDHDLLHLDLKPSNVIADRGRAKLIDLSVARPIGTRAKGVGTRRYMSPEQLAGGVLTDRADSWGLGTVLLEAATGRAAFSKDRRPGEATSALERAEALPPPLTEVLSSCLDPEPSRRPSPREVFAGLSRT